MALINTDYSFNPIALTTAPHFACSERIKCRYSSGVDRLYSVGSLVLQQPEVVARAAKIGLDVVQLSPQVAERALLEEAKIYVDLGRKLGMEQK